MADRPFKTMSREAPRPNPCIEVTCDRCGGKYLTGDWPFCRPGHPEDHRRE